MLPESHDVLRLRRLEEEGRVAFDALVKFQGSPHISRCAARYDSSQPCMRLGSVDHAATITDNGLPVFRTIVAASSVSVGCFTCSKNRSELPHNVCELNVDALVWFILFLFYQSTKQITLQTY